MANTKPWTKVEDPSRVAVKCASAVTDVRLAYRFLTTDHETVTLCGDNERLCGFPDKKAAAGEAFTLFRDGDITAVASGAVTINDPITTAAAGKVRLAVYATDHIQGWADSTAADGEPVTVRIRL